MDCRWALEILDSARPDSADWQERELEEAAAHVDQCPVCDETFRARQALDRRVGAVMRDVPVPGDLLGRLTATLSVAGHNEAIQAVAASTAAPFPTGFAEADSVPGDIAAPSPASKAPMVQPVDRRRWMRTVAASLAVCTVLGLGGWLWFRTPAPTLTVDGIVDTAPLHLERLDVFEKNFDAAPPLAWANVAIQFDGEMRGFGRNRRDEHVMALVEFSFPGWDGSPLTGILVIVPKAEVNCVGLAGDFLSATSSPKYPPSGGYTAVSWVSGDFVYVCFIPEQGDAQHRLEHILGNAAA